MKDLFSTQAADYSKFRPRYPESLFSYLASIAPARGLVWDCGTGNGQAAVELARHFESVHATDPSEKQLANAEKNPRVRYERGSAEHSPLADQSADLVTVAQAFHWFDQEAFYREVRRVLRPRGIVAIWCYAVARITPEVDQVMDELYEGILGSYWEPERRQVEEGYSRASFPFDELKHPGFSLTAEWSAEHLIGYFGTWSSLQTYIRKNGKNPLETIAPRVRQAWGSQPLRTVSWPLALRVGRVD